jgi:hypothetical protein
MIALARTQQQQNTDVAATTAPLPCPLPDHFVQCYAAGTRCVHKGYGACIMLGEGIYCLQKQLHDCNAVSGIDKDESHRRSV